MYRFSRGMAVVMATRIGDQMVNCNAADEGAAAAGIVVANARSIHSQQIEGLDRPWPHDRRERASNTDGPHPIGCFSWARFAEVFP